MPCNLNIITSIHYSFFQILASVNGAGHRPGIAHRRLRNSILEAGQLSNSPKLQSRILGRSGLAAADLPFWHPTTPALVPGFGNKIEPGAGDNLDNHALDYNDEGGDYVVDRPVPNSDYRDGDGYRCSVCVYNRNGIGSCPELDLVI